MKKGILSNKKLICSSLLALSLGLCGNSIAQTNVENSVKKGSADSTSIAVIGLGTTTPPTKNFQASSIMPFSKPGLTCTTPWGQVIQDNTEVAAYKTPTGTYNYTTGTYADDCIEEQRHCTNGVLSGSYQYQTCTIKPVNGTCGIANGAYYTYPTSGPASTDQCNPSYTYGGVAPSDESPPSVPATSGAYLNTTTNVYNWTCSGEAGGGSASCFAYRKINGQCGSSTNSCNLGNSASPSTTDNYNPNYKCSCSTNTSGVTTCTANASGNQTCTGGYRDTTYAWNCMGINTGANASCSNNVYISSKDTQPAPPCGATSQAQSSSCPSGYNGTQSRTNTVDSCTGTIIAYGSWNTSSCTLACTNSYSTQSASCPSGYSGTQYRSVTTNSCTGTSYGSWDTSGCTYNAPTCTTSSSTESASCPSGYSGTQYRSVNYNSCTGTTYGSWNTAGCTPVQTCTTSSSTESASCPSGYTGTQTRTVTTNSCTGTTYGSWNTSGCTPVPMCGIKTSQETQRCSGAGVSGSQYRTVTTNTCTGTTSYGAWDTSGCCGGTTKSPGGAIYYNACN
jgi:hypothetical protein